MNGSELLNDGFDRITQIVHRAGDGLDTDDLAVRLDRDANSIGWLIWHLSRNQDDHVAEVAGSLRLMLAERHDIRHATLQVDHAGDDEAAEALLDHCDVPHGRVHRPVAATPDRPS